MPGFNLIKKNKSNKNNNNYKNISKVETYNYINNNRQLGKYQYQEYRERMYKKKAEKNEINMNLNEQEYGAIFKTVSDSCNPQKRNVTDLKNSKNKNHCYEYIGNPTFNSKKIYDTINPNQYSPNGLNEIKTKFYLILDISNKRSNQFLIKYNSKIFVRDITKLIKEQLIYEKNSEENIDILEKIITSEGYKLALINSFGFFITFLEQDDYELTNILKYDGSLVKLKHLCLYDFKEIKKGQEIKNLIAVHFLSKAVLDKIIKKNNIYENFDFDKINIPVFIINENINSEEILFGRVQDLYVNYFGNLAQKNNELKIYIMNTSDIMDLNVTKITYIELNHNSINFSLYFDTIGLNTGYGMQKYNTKRLLVGV